MSIGEYPRFGIDLGVVCKRCGRTTVFDPADVARYFYEREIPRSLPVDTSLFKCRCGSRKVKTIGVPIEWRPDPLPPPPWRLDPLYVKDEGK
jgi:hypothetical protein